MRVDVRPLYFAAVFIFFQAILGGIQPNFATCSEMLNTLCKFFVFPSFAWRSPNGTQENFATCSAMTQIWKWTLQCVFPLPRLLGPQKQNRLFLVLLRRHINADVFGTKGAIDKRKNRFKLQLAPTPKIWWTLANKRLKLTAYVAHGVQGLPSDCNCPALLYV